MNTIQKIGQTFLLLFILFSAGCGKEDFSIPDAEMYTQVFIQAASSGTITKTFPMEDNWMPVDIGAGYGGSISFEKDISIKFEINPSLIDSFNRVNVSNYTLPPENSFRFEHKEVIIPRGHNGSNSVQIEINPVKLGGTASFLLPVSIVEVSDGLRINQELKTVFLVVNGIYEQNPFTTYPQTGWSILDYSDDDYDAVGGRAPYCIDGDINTSWLSTWRRDSTGSRPGHPHHVAIDMGQTNELHGITLYGRRGASFGYLFPKNVEIETSVDGNTWNIAGLFSITASPEETAATMYFEKSVSCRYFRCTILSSLGGGETTAVAELMAF